MSYVHLRRTNAAAPYALTFIFIAGLGSRAVPRCANRTEMHTPHGHLASFFAGPEAGDLAFHGNIFPIQIRPTSLFNPRDRAQSCDVC